MTETSTNTKASGKSSGSGGSSTKAGRLESTVAGLKRKKLHSDNAGGDTPLLRKVSCKIICHPQMSHLAMSKGSYFLIRFPYVLK